MSFDCCDDPKPRINDLDGTFFCASCHRGLSVSIEQPDTVGPESSTDTDHERENS